MVDKFGETPAEAESREMLRCRQVVAEILGFGVTQTEIMRIVHLLSLELEDRELMVDLSDRVRTALKDSTAALSSRIIET